MTLPTTMQVATLKAFGAAENVSLETQPVHVPRDKEILVRVAATTVNSGDVRIRTQRFPQGFGIVARLIFGWRKPRIKVLGTELCGTVVAIGQSVSRFAVGDEVIAMPGLGTHQDYRAMPETKAIAKRPDGLAVSEAAALCFGGTTALHFLRKAGAQRGERLLVIGATGTVGSAVLQLARQMGLEVIAATSAANMELAASLGADAVLDYAAPGYIAAHGPYDIIADTNAATSFDAVFDALKPGGRYLAIAGGLNAQFKSGKGGKQQITGVVAERAEDIEYLAALAEQGQFVPLVDSTFAFKDIVAAHARAESGRKRGSVVVLMA